MARSNNKTVKHGGKRKGAGRKKYTAKQIAGLLDELFQKIQPWLQLGYSFHKACRYGKVVHETYREYAEADLNFLDKVERERTLINTVARKNVFKSIQAGNVADSWAWLETQEKDDFSKKTITENTNPDDLQKMDKITEIITKLSKDAKQFIAKADKRVAKPIQD